MKSLSEELNDFAHLCETVGLSPVEKAEAINGAQLFFQSGWPANFVTTGWALRASHGLVPPEYKGVTSIAEYANRILNHAEITAFAPEMGESSGATVGGARARR